VVSSCWFGAFGRNEWRQPEIKHVGADAASTLGAQEHVGTDAARALDAEQHVRSDAACALEVVGRISLK
jgi:hypothetical protein